MIDMVSKMARLDRPEPSSRLHFRQHGPDVDSESVLAALDDPDCRKLLEATTDEALTAQELADRCEVPRSTTYRKVEQLTEAGLLEEGVRLRTDGKHASEYRRSFDDITISLSASDGFEVGISQSEPVIGD